MFESPTTIGWGGGVLWLVGVGAAAFLVSWLMTDVLHVRRLPYVAWLALLTAGTTAGYLAWSGLATPFWVDRWPWGILAAVLAGAFLAVMVRRIPTHHGTGRVRGADALWEGLVYGSAEGILLSVLPVAITWQTLAALGWTEGWRGVAAGAAAVAASVVVIVAHHLGYRSYRGRAIASPVVGCTVLSIAYLVTASPIAAMGGHVILHLAMQLRGLELPPHARGAPADHALETSGVLVGRASRGD